VVFFVFLIPQDASPHFRRARFSDAALAASLREEKAPWMAPSAPEGGPEPRNRKLRGGGFESSSGQKAKEPFRVSSLFLCIIISIKQYPIWKTAYIHGKRHKKQICCVFLYSIYNCHVIDTVYHVIYTA
jgi:hypothetical protein